MSDHFISAAIKHSGAFKAKAQAHGMSTEAYAEKCKDAPGLLGQQARLAKTLLHLHKHGNKGMKPKPKTTIGSNC